MLPPQEPTGSLSESLSPQLSPEHLWQRLEERGIVQAARDAGWTPKQCHSKRWPQPVWGWSYPIFDPSTGQRFLNPQGRPVLRWKNYDKSLGGEKYLWLYGQQGCPPYYILPHTREAVEQAQGLIYVVNGEPAVLAMHAAGYPNALCWLNGETSDHSDLATVLADLGVITVYYIYDKDDTGTKTAAELVQRLSNSAFELVLIKLPDDLAVKADVNDLWIKYQFNRTPFDMALEQIVNTSRSCQTLIREAVAQSPGAGSAQFNLTLEQNDNTARSSQPQIRDAKAWNAGAAPADRKRSSDSGTRSDDVPDWNLLRTEWIQWEVMPALDRAAPVQGHGKVPYRHCPSPNHTDAHPSFRISYDRDSQVGIPQCSCDIQHERYPWDRVAEWVGAMPLMDWFKAQHPPTRPSARPSAHTSIPNEPAVTASPSSSWNRDHNPPTPAGTPQDGSSRPSREFTDMGNALRLVDHCGQDLHFIADRGQWLMWKDVRWEPDALGHIMQAAKDTVKAMKEEVHLTVDVDKKAQILKHAKASQAHARLKAMTALAQSEPGIPVLTSSLDSDPWKLGVANGVIDLHTGELLSQQRDDLITKQSPVAYDPERLRQLQDHGLDALAPVFARFVNDLTEKSPTLKTFLQRWFGYTLTGDISEEVYLLLYGEGQNGKTKLLELVAAMMGDYAVKARYESFVRKVGDPQGHTSDLARLAGARFVYATEGNEGRPLNVALVNELTGGDRVTASRKYENEFEYYPQLKLVLATNHKPTIQDTSRGIWRRTLLWELNHVIPPEQRDNNLLSKMKTELPTVLAWAVQGCLDWRAEDLAIPPEISRSSQAFRDEQDVILQFVRARCMVDPTASSVRGSILYAAYETYCQATHQPRQQIGEFYHGLERLDGVTRREEHHQTSFRGIQINEV